jgi:hypothetical protein
MKYVFLTFLLASKVFAGFDLPSSVFEPDEYEEASAEAIEENKPLVILVAGHKSS